jgi:hypothetical protein
MCFAAGLLMDKFARYLPLYLLPAPAPRGRWNQPEPPLAHATVAAVDPPPLTCSEPRPGPGTSFERRSDFGRLKLVGLADRTRAGTPLGPQEAGNRG